jgi:hypothetical protein
MKNQQANEASPRRYDEAFKREALRPMEEQREFGGDDRA